LHAYVPWPLYFHSLRGKPPVSPADNTPKDTTGLKEAVGHNKNWYKDRYEAVITQRNFLGIIALSSLLLALAAGFIILLILPAKTVMPFLIQVDEKSGYTTIIEQNSRDRISADESLRRYFIIKFLKARESYDSADLDVNSNIVRLLADRPIYRAYWDQVVNTNNKNSLYVQLGALYTRQVEIKSVQFLDANRAQVRLTINEGKKDSVGSMTQKHYIALITFRFVNLNLTLEEMAINPLSFQAMEYRLDQDSFL
jgi:type IV secretion system protein VirB8